MFEDLKIFSSLPKPIISIIVLYEFEVVDRFLKTLVNGRDDNYYSSLANKYGFYESNSKYILSERLKEDVNLRIEFYSWAIETLHIKKDYFISFLVSKVRLVDLMAVRISNIQFLMLIKPVIIKFVLKKFDITGNDISDIVKTINKDYWINMTEGKRIILELVKESYDKVEFACMLSHYLMEFDNVEKFKERLKEFNINVVCSCMIRYSSFKFEDEDRKQIIFKYLKDKLGEDSLVELIEETKTPYESYGGWNNLCV